MPLALTLNATTQYLDDSEQLNAMRRYWNARREGDKTAKLEKVDAIYSQPAAEANASHSEVSTIAVARIQRHEHMLADRGIAIPPPVYAAGSKVVQLGLDNFRTSRTEWELLPTTIEGLRGVYEAVEAEEREDHIIRVRDLHMLDDGSLKCGAGELLLEMNGLRALVSRNAEVFPRAGEYLSVIDPELRATNFNRQIALVNTEKKLKLRVRRGAGGLRQIFAVTSPRYASFDADQIAVVLSSALMDSGMRGEVIYDPASTNLRVDGLYHADKVVDLAAGDVFKVGVQFRSNDAAGGAIRGRAIAWRNLCLNLIIIGTGEVDLLRRRHIGAVSNVLTDVTLAASQAGAIFEDFAIEWGALRSTSAKAAFGVSTTPDAIVELAQMKELDVGIKRDVLVELLMQGWHQEPGDTLADLVNAVTSTHLLDEVDLWRRERFEEAAGRLVPVLARLGEA